MYTSHSHIFTSEHTYAHRVELSLYSFDTLGFVVSLVRSPILLQLLFSHVFFCFFVLGIVAMTIFFSFLFTFFISLAIPVKSYIEWSARSVDRTTFSALSDRESINQKSKVAKSWKVYNQTGTLTSKHMSVCIVYDFRCGIFCMQFGSLL